MKTKALLLALTGLLLVGCGGSPDSTSGSNSLDAAQKQISRNIKASAPFGSAPAAIPGTVYAENYDTGGQGVGYNVSSVNGTANSYRADGVDLEITSAAGGGNNLGWTAAGQWFHYTVNVVTAGTYAVTFTVAAPGAVTDAFHLSNSSGTNLSGPVNVAATGSWQTWTTVTANVTLPAGQQVLILNQDNAGWNIDQATFALSTSTSGEAPYGGTPAAIPGTVHAENYDTGGQGAGYNVTSTNGTANSYRTDGVDLEATSAPGGGNSLGWAAAGQWFRYTVNVATAGTYTIAFEVAAPSAVTSAFHLSNSSGANLSGPVAVPATGGWQTWATVTASVTLPAGRQVLTLNEDNGGWNIDQAVFSQSNSINVLSYGAVGDGATDNQTSLQNAFNAAQSQGKPVWIPAGVFNHSGVLSANGIAIQGAGFNAILQATNPNASAIELQGNAPSLSNLKTQVVAPNRSNQPQTTAIWILNATNASVKNVILQGASSNGVRLDGATHATISNNLVLGTNADGIAATNGASHNTITNNLVYQSADDAYSDDSYVGEPQDVGNQFTNNVAYHIPYGRGFAAAGSTGGTFNGNTINGTTWIGIYAETDTSSNTQVTSNYTLENNVVLNANTTVASNYTAFNGNPVGGWLISGNGMVVANNQTTGTMPNLATVLGWDPTPYMVDRYSFNPTYVPGTGPGSNN